ncbi:MAG: Hsp20/alpha crystallin family protein [Balneolaceae bacterium]
MTLVRFNRPDANVAGKRFSDVMDEFFNDFVSARRDNFVPSIDVSETDKEFIIEAQLPGMEKKDINVDIDNGMLNISGERTIKKEENGRKFHRVETEYGAFNRRLQLPDNVNHESIKAAYKDGILSISIEKSEERVKKQISIK